MKRFKNKYKSLPEIITTSQLSQLVNLSTYSIKKMVHDGKLKKHKLSTLRRFMFNKSYAVKEILDIEIIDIRKESFKKYTQYFHDLFTKAYSTDSLETIFAILEVDGMYAGHWNPTEEINRFFDDFNILLTEAIKDRKYKFRKYRLALLMYCHLLEMNFWQKLLFNILRIVNNKTYVLNPFSHSYKKPPSLSWKINEIKKSANHLKESDLVTYIDEFYIDEVRNSFYHSDYCIDKNIYRYKKKQRFGKYTNFSHINLPLDDLEGLITKSFAFFEALFNVHKSFRKQLANINKFHKMPQYEVLELLSKDGLLNGFNMHFSNGSKATFIREPEEVKAINIVFNQDGSINFMVGNLNKLTTQWKVNGKVFNN